MFSFTEEEKVRFIWILRMSAFGIEYYTFHNDIDGILWVREIGEEWSCDTIAAAVIGGHFELAKWLRQQGCEWNSQTMYLVVREGNIAGIKWLEQESYPWYGDTRVRKNIHLINNNPT